MPPLTLPVRACFVCLGNICRSPMGPPVLRARAAAMGIAGEVVAGSAGTGRWHLGQPADPRAQAALARRGYAIDHVAREFRPGEFDEWDVILAMDVNNVYDLRELAPRGADTSKVKLLRSFDPAAPPRAQVPDPYYGSDADFDHVLDLIEAGCQGLLEQLLATASP